MSAITSTQHQQIMQHHYSQQPPLFSKSQPPPPLPPSHLSHQQPHPHPLPHLSISVLAYILGVVPVILLLLIFFCWWSKTAPNPTPSVTANVSDVNPEPNDEPPQYQRHPTRPDEGVELVVLTRGAAYFSVEHGV
ncbi:hypothetical protein BC829DRAFT_422646 [Chytridium lagenaria]|nr:hypothetical protein BC829DRAFT_422646 [Chytridium lagenaria]